MSAADGTMRAFIALDLDADARARIASLTERLAEAKPASLKASFLDACKVHVTMKFLGPTRIDRVAPLTEVLREAWTRDAVPTQALRIGAFGSLARAHVVVLELADVEGRLASIARAIDARTEALGFARESRDFRPHVTLARLRRGADVRRWIDAMGAFTPFDARLPSLTLYRSDASREGSVYTAVATA